MAEEEESLSLIEQARLLFPFFTTSQVKAYAEAWAETGDRDLAMAQFRANPKYDRWFPGNRRDDGTVHLTEFDYASTVEGYKREIANAGIVPSVLLTKKRIRRLIESGTSVDEFGEQVQNLRTGVTEQGDLVREAFGRLFGVETGQGISDAAIFAAAFDAAAPDDLSRDLLTLQRDIAAAQVSAEGKRFGFGFLDPTQARGFVGVGLGQERARELFAQGAELIPNLNRLREAFSDPDNPLDLSRFVSAMQTGDVEDMAQIERLLRRSAGQFSAQGTFASAGEEGIQALRES